MNILKQSTAATIKLGPFIDDGDGKTAETGLTISQADIHLSKNGGDIAQTNNSTGATHDELGYYNVPLDTTDTNTLGRLKVMVHESGALPVWDEYLVVTANVYDTLCSTDKLEVELATGHGLATATALQTVDDNVDAILTDTGTTLSNLITSIKAKTDLMDASAITYTPNVVGTAVTLLRGDTFSATLTDVGALTGYVSIDFTVKRNTSNTDDEAVIRIRKNASGTGDGLLRLNRAAPTTETGEIVVDDEATGDITITLDETATDSLEIGAYLYDVQLITATAVKTLTSGRLNVTSDVTRAIV